MKISFHQGPVVVTALSADLKAHGAVYWHTSRPNFHQVSDLIKAQGIDVISLCARPNGGLLNFLVRVDLVDDLTVMENQVAEAISRWQVLGEPVPHVQAL